MGPKRRRLALSCVACRARKVKCDRTYPTCVRCQKGAVTCDYVSYTKQDLALPTPSDESPHVRREVSVESWTGKLSHSSLLSIQSAHNIRPSREPYPKDPDMLLYTRRAPLAQFIDAIALSTSIIHSSKTDIETYSVV